VRPVLHADVVAAARCLLAVPVRCRSGLIRWLILTAGIADRYRCRAGRAHPRFGGGCLETATLGFRKCPEPSLDDPEYCECLVLVLEALVAWRLAAGRGMGRARARGYAREREFRYSPFTGGKFGLSRKDNGASQGRRMAESKANIAGFDPVWERIRTEAHAVVEHEPILGGLVHSGILHHRDLERSLAYRMALKLASGEMTDQILREIVDEAYRSEPDLGQAARADIVAVFERDPACHRFIQPVLFFKGFQGVQAYRVAHWLWQQDRRELAYFIQMRVSEVFGIDIHPAARIGQGIMIDHAHSIVIGETAVVGDNVSMLHSVTLGGTGKADGDRHPKIENGVLIGAGAKVLGNITVGYCTRIAAGSVVLQDVPPCKTVAGVPARIVGEAGCAQPSVTMNQVLDGR